MSEEIKEKVLLSCTVKIGEQVKLIFVKEKFETINCYIRAIIFSNAKVRFSIFLSEEKTTLHNVDSCFIEKLENPNFLNFEDDIYS